MGGFSFFLSLKVALLSVLLLNLTAVHSHNKHGGDGVQPLSQIQIHRAVYELHENASVTANPVLLGTMGEDSQWVTVEVSTPKPSEDDWLAVFSPANFNSSTCQPNEDLLTPCISTAPIKPKLVAVSNVTTFANPKAPLYPRLALGKHWDEMTVTWTSGYNIDEDVPFVEWGLKGESQIRSPSGTLIFTRETVWSTGTNSWLARSWFHPHKFSERFVAKFIVCAQREKLDFISYKGTI